MIGTPGFVEILAIAGLALLPSIAALLFLEWRCRARAKRTIELMPPHGPEIVGPRAISDGWRPVVPHGGETFFERAAHAGAIYDIEVVGVCGVRPQRQNVHQIDALYRALGLRFRLKHRELLINGNALDHYSCRTLRNRPTVEMIDEDRAAHRYRFQFDGAPVALALGDSRPLAVGPELGCLYARVACLPPGSKTLRQQESEARLIAEEAERCAEERHKAEALADRFAEIVKKLSIRADMNRNWRDPQYREKFARAHCAELIAHQSEIRTEAEQLLMQSRLISYLQRHAPDVVPTLLGRLESLIIAERMALDRALVDIEAPPERKAIEEQPKRKRTSKEVMAAKVRHQQIKLGDRVALAMDKVETVEKMKARVRAQFGHLDEDEQHRIIQEVLDEVAEGEENTRTL